MRRTGRRATSRSGAAAALVLILVLSGCSGGGEGPEASEFGPTIVTRGQDFSEARTITKVYALHLEALGYPVEVLTAAGFRTEAIQALEAGEVSLIIDYIGGSMAALVPDAAPTAAVPDILAAIRPAYAALGARVLEASPAVDGDALVVRGDFDAETISDLALLDVVFGAAAQCFERPQCFVGLTDPARYGLVFSATRTIEFGPLLGEALKAGVVDAVIWNDTAPQIGVEGFRVLRDDRGLFPAQNIAPILSEALIAAYGDDLVRSLDALSALITTEDLIAWNVETDLRFREPSDVAREWLESRGLLG
jgi:osmoprotectant transport system substrate-binding protein